MNYAEWHLGDYAEATAHLSLIEDGAYSRMLRKYYATEQPLPGEKREIYRLISARSKDEREAVDAVLADFFTLEPDGKYHQARADAEIAKYHAKQGDREAKRENERERQHRARERRKTLFDQLRERGIVPDFDATTAQLEAELSRVTNADRHANVTPPVTRTDTAIQSPVTSHQSPDLNSKAIDPDPSVLQPAEAVGLMRDAGMAVANPGHPKLIALCAMGITAAEFVAAVHTAKANGKGFGYAIACAANARAEVSGLGKPKHRETIHDKRARTAAALGTKDNAPKGATYDSTATLVD